MIGELIEHEGKTYRVIASLRQWQEVGAVARKTPRSRKRTEPQVQAQTPSVEVFPSWYVGTGAQGTGERNRTERPSCLGWTEMLGSGGRLEANMETGEVRYR